MAKLLSVSALVVVAIAAIQVVSIGYLVFEVARTLHGKRDVMEVTSNNREQRAADLLRHILGETEYMRYRVEGFVDVPSKLYPNIFYRVRPNGSGVLVLLSAPQSELLSYAKKYLNGPIYDLYGGRAYFVMAVMCVFASREFPQDDGTAAIYLLAKHQEELLRAQANIVGDYYEWSSLMNLDAYP